MLYRGQKAQMETFEGYGEKSGNGEVSGAFQRRRQLLIREALSTLVIDRLELISRLLPSMPLDLETTEKT